MTTWFVTRHPGAVFWAASVGVKVADRGIVSDLDPEMVQPGDTVVGTLPVNVAARIVERGGKYLHLALNLPLEARGRELTADDMRNYGARLQAYDIKSLGEYQTQTNNVSPGKSVMVVIASGQTIPNLLPLQAFSEKPTHLFIVVSTSADAKASASNIKRVAERQDISVTEFPDAPVAPMAAVQSFAHKCYDEIRLGHPGASIVLNATGGTKIMSAGFSSALGPAGTVIYCDTANDQIEYFSPQGRSPAPLPADLLDLETYLLAQGQKIVARPSDGKEWLALSNDRAKVTNFFADMLGMAPLDRVHLHVNHIAALNKASNRALQDAEGHDHWIPNQTISDIPRSLAERLANAGLLTVLAHKPGRTEVEFTSDSAARYICGGWLEEFCALTMKKLDVPPKHWGCGVKIRPIGLADDVAPNNDPRSLNEIDLALVWRNRLLVVECKTGKQLQYKESQPILNKLEAIRNYAAGTFGTGWLLNVRLLEINSPVFERANAYRITLHEREAITVLPQLIARWMGRTLSDRDLQTLDYLEARVQSRQRERGR